MSTYFLKNLFNTNKFTLHIATLYTYTRTYSKSIRTIYRTSIYKPFIEQMVRLVQTNLNIKFWSKNFLVYIESSFTLWLLSKPCWAGTWCRLKTCTSPLLCGLPPVSEESAGLRNWNPDFVFPVARLPSVHLEPMSSIRSVFACTSEN